jgi:NSS family neurotransmitter:Na+ symporter
MLKESIHGQWSGRAVFIMAATGSAVGLSNIWRFPYLVSEYGGGLFILIYLFCITLIGLPVIMAEIMIGRMGRQSPINSIRQVAEQSGRSRHWQFIGWMSVVAGFLILSFYSVIAGWSMAYVFRTSAGVFDGITEDGASAIFGFLVNDPERLLAWHTLFILLTYYVVSHGLHRGLEIAVKLLMPALLVVLLLLLGFSMSSGYFLDGMSHFLAPSAAHLSDVKNLGFVILSAMGQAFFTLSLGAGAIMIYGAYLPSNVSITGASIAIVVLDMLFAIIVGMIIYPIILANGLETTLFSNGLDASYGPGLVFQTLPLAFGQMPWGNLFGGLFFVLIVIAAITSSIALLEPIVAYLIERYGWSRRHSASLAAFIAWILGLGTIFSFNIWSGVYPLAALDAFSEKTIYHLLDMLASNILLPLGGLLTVIFAGWILPWKTTEDELSMGQEYCGFAIWRMLVRYVTPVLLFIVLVYSLLKATGYVNSP